MRVLLALPLALAACGDNLPGPQDPAGNGVDQSGATDTDTVARYVPEICGAQTYGVAAATDSVVRAVPMTGSVALFTVPASGGTLRGVLIDGRGTVIGNPEGTKIRGDLPFASLAASRVDDRFIVSAVDGSSTHVMAIRDDLGDFRELAVSEGSLIGERSVVRTRNGRVALTAGAKGVFSTELDSAWSVMGTKVVAQSPATSMTSTAYGANDAMVAWSTGSECHVARVAAGDESMRSYPCANARLAVDFDQRGGWMVYEDHGSVKIAQIMVGGHNMIANEALLAPYGSSPRIAFDGVHYWASYLDAHGTVVVGMLDEHGAIDSLALEGTTPAPEAYDLVVSQGAASVYTADHNGLGGTRICKAIAQ